MRKLRISNETESIGNFGATGIVKGLFNVNKHGRMCIKNVTLISCHLLSQLNDKKLWNYESCCH